jgi:hypothetical protein
MRIFVDGSFRGHVAVALAEASIIDRQHRKAEVAQLFQPEHLSGEAPARAVEIEHRRGVGIFGRPPPRMDALRVGAMVHRNIEFMDAVGQPCVPPRHLLDHAEGKPLLLVLQRRRAAGRQHSHDGNCDEQPSGEWMAFSEGRGRHDHEGQ